MKKRKICCVCDPQEKQGDQQSLKNCGSASGQDTMLAELVELESLPQYGPTT